MGYGTPAQAIIGIGPSQNKTDYVSQLYEEGQITAPILTLNAGFDTMRAVFGNYEIDKQID